jgi:hypothetical protein
MTDTSEPATSKLTHLRPKTYKQDLFKKREVQQENDHLVLKILKLRKESRERVNSMTNLDSAKKRNGFMTPDRRKSEMKLFGQSRLSRRNNSLSSPHFVQSL